MCPTKQRDLADGIGPARRLLTLGSPLALGSDSHAVVDPFEEMRALELDERLASGARGIFSAHQLLEAATSAGYAALGVPTGGRLSPGAPADFVTVLLTDRPGRRSRGFPPGWGRPFRLPGRRHRCGGIRPAPCPRGQHLLVGDVAGALRAAINALAWP